MKLEIYLSFSIGVLLSDGTTELYGYGYNDNTRNHPDSLTLYEIGSVTKTFTATLAGIFLKDAMKKSLSWIFGSIENSKLDSILPHGLLNHIAGVPRLSNQFLPQRSDPFNGYSLDIFNAELEELKSDNSQLWMYPNFGYSILRRAIEIVFETSFENLIDGFLESTGMENNLLRT